jgi:DNA-binding transcriptional LysR family regulator
MITLDRLRYFTEVAKLEHVGQAAKSLSISPSVISSAIKTLEEELSCELFTRNNNKIKINENGRILLQEAASILDKTNNLYESVGSSSPQLKGQFTVGADPFLMKNYLIDTCLEVQKDHKNILFSFPTMDTGFAISKILSGELDLALIFRSTQYQDIETCDIYSGQFNVAVHKNHPILNATKKQRIKLLNELPAITFKASVGMNYVHNHPIFKEHQINPRRAYNYDNDESCVKLLLKTNGWALLPDLVIKKHKKNITTLQISTRWDAPLKISLIKNKTNISSYLFDLIKNDLEKVLF